MYVRVAICIINSGVDDVRVYSPSFRIIEIMGLLIRIWSAFELDLCNGTVHFDKRSDVGVTDTHDDRTQYAAVTQ